MSNRYKRKDLEKHSIARVFFYEGHYGHLLSLLRHMPGEHQCSNNNYFCRAFCRIFKGNINNNNNERNYYEDYLEYLFLLQALPLSSRYVLISICIYFF